MALRAIRLNRDPVLYRKCREVEQVDDKVRQLLDDMLQTPTALRLRLRR